MGKPDLLRRRSRSSDGRLPSTSYPSSPPSAGSPSRPRRSAQGPPNFFYQDPTDSPHSPAAPSAFPSGPNSPAKSSFSPSSASPSRNGFLAPPAQVHHLQQQQQAPSSLRQQPPHHVYQFQPPPALVNQPPRTAASLALPGAPPLLSPPPSLARGTSSGSLASQLSAESDYSSFNDEEVGDLASDQEDDFVLPVAGSSSRHEALPSSLASIQPSRMASPTSLAPPLSNNLRPSSPAALHTPATSVHSRDTSPQLLSSASNVVHGRTPSGSIISAAPLTRNESQDNKRSKLPPLTTEFVPPPAAASKHDFFVESAGEESWQARGRRYEEAATAALLSPQSTYSQGSPATVARRVTNGGSAAGTSRWGVDHASSKPDASPPLDLSLATFPSSSMAPPLPRNQDRPLSLRTSRPLGSPTKPNFPPLSPLDQLPPAPPPRYTSPPPPSAHVYSPLTPTPNNSAYPAVSSIAAQLKSDVYLGPGPSSSTSFGLLPRISASASTTFGDSSLMSHFGEDAFMPSDIATLSTLLATPRVLRGILEQLPIQSVLSLWEAGSKKERMAMDGGRWVREEFRAWGLGWAGYVRGGLDKAGAREGWATLSTGTILDFLSTLSLPPTAILPPHLVLASSVVTLLLRTSHSLLPPSGPHLIPFEEEDCLPLPLQGLHPNLPPSARTRALPNGRELVFPAPLASAIDLAATASVTNSSLYRGDSRNSGAEGLAGPRKLRRRSSISSVMSGVTWAANRAKGGAPSINGAASPSAFNGQRVASSSASIYSTNDSMRVNPPTPRYPEPRRYEFSQQPLHPPRTRPLTNDSRLSLDSYANSHAGSIYSTNNQSFAPRQRSVTAAPNGWRGDAQGSSSNLSQLPSVYHDPDAPPMPNLLNPAYKKHGSRDSSMLNLSYQSGSSTQSPSGGLSNLALGGPSGAGRPGFFANRSSSPDSSGSSNPSFAQRRGNGHLQRHQPGPIEPLFLSSASPFRFNRAPIVRVVVPLPRDIAWPSGAALKLCHRELDASGLLSKMKFGDLVENLCVSHARRGVPGGWTSGAMVFIPPFLHPLSFAHSASASLTSPTSPNPSSSSSRSFFPAHLPPTMDSFLHSPTFYHAVLPLPYIIFLDLLPFGEQIFNSLRLANQRTELPSSRGEILSVDVWIHEAAFVIPGGSEGGWGGGGGGAEGMEKGPWAGTTVILESDGTKEGKDELLARISGRPGARRPWEILGSKSTRGSVWLKLIRETIPVHEA